LLGSTKAFQQCHAVPGAIQLNRIPQFHADSLVELNRRP
jgi:hypothetical protein